MGRYAQGLVDKWLGPFPALAADFSGATEGKGEASALERLAAPELAEGPTGGLWTELVEELGALAAVDEPAFAKVTQRCPSASLVAVDGITGPPSGGEHT